MSITARSFVFDTLPDGLEVAAIALEAGDLRATILSHGATLQSLCVPDRQGEAADIVLGHDRLAPYVEQPTYLGAIVGRYANRIAGAHLTIAGRVYDLSANEGRNSLHGGREGFDKRLWTVDEAGVRDDETFVRLSLVSPDGDQGYPGALHVEVVYRLSANSLTIDFTATTDAATAINLTNHALFNLRGAASGQTALDAELTVQADVYTPVDALLIPTGEWRDVTGTVFDFRQGRRLVDGVRDATDAQVRIGRGYDHNLALRGGRTADPKPAARLYDSVSGRQMEILTTEPGLQLYTGNFLDGTLPGKGGILYRQGDGIALETQNFPNAPNQSGFPAAWLKPGEVYRQVSVFRLSIV